LAGVSFSELLLLFVIGLLILGPERLPRVASQIGRWVGRARRTANQLRYQLEREIALSDIEASKKKSPPPAKPAARETGSTPGRAGGDAAAREAPAPEAPAPEASAPEASAPEASVPEASVPGASVPGASAPKASAPETANGSKEPPPDSTRERTDQS
jgi:sec-independent protein translocase protein TatB